MNKRKTKKYQEKMKLKADIEAARKSTIEAIQFLVDIGSKKHRAKYNGSNKDLSRNKEEILDYFLREVTAVTLLRHLCKGKSRCKSVFRNDIFDEADKIMEEITNG